MIDIHTHILYGIDDGAKSKEESLEIIKNAAMNHITDIILTPHYIKDTTYTCNNKNKKTLLKELKNTLKKEKININLYLGNEIYIDEDIVSLLKSDVFTLNNSKYILIELPLSKKVDILESVIVNLQAKKLIPIIAHPERYLAYYKEYDFFKNLIDNGCLFQANIGSLYGIYGRKSKRMLKELIKRNMIHFLGSDIHSAKSNIYEKNIEYDLLKLVKDKNIVEDLLINNARKLLNNEIIGVTKMDESRNLELNTDSVISLEEKITQKLHLIFKRLFDIICSSLGLVVSFPLFIIIGALIRLEDGSSPLFKQERIGKNGKIFKLYKFRSMVKNADEILFNTLEMDKVLADEYKKNKKLKNDPRVTKVGKFIRKTSLDELPQLINVLKGEMSLIGNRPYLPREKEDMGEYYNDIIKTKPGITGYWQVSGRSAISFNERCKLESFYSNNMSLLMDVKIFFKTFIVVLLGKGAE